MTKNSNHIHTPPQAPQHPDDTYKATYRDARDLGYSELEAMAYASEPDLFADDHPEASENDAPEQPPTDATRNRRVGDQQ